MMLLFFYIAEILKLVHLILRFENYNYLSIKEIPDWIVSIIVGLLTGIISSFLVSKHYWKKDIMRNARGYYSNLNAYIRALVHVLFDFQLFYNQSDKTNTNYDDYIDSIRDVFATKPYFDKLYCILPEVKYAYPKFENLLKRLSSLLSTYDGRKHVLIILNNENIDYTPEELNDRINRARTMQLEAVQNLSFMSSNFQFLLKEMNDKFSI